jgi:alanyl-tRNA synthetase
MTQRLYYTDAYTTRFSARIIETTKYRESAAVILDQSYFYPTSGGQPHDTGQLRQGDQSVPVIDVVVRPSDNAVLHILERELLPDKVGDQIEGEIDRPRRFDHMQQHSGQHILSQAFIRLVEAETVGFHLSDKTVTIDLDQAAISNTQVEAVERLCNEVIWQNRPVTFREVSPEEARLLPLRKVPDGLGEKLRLIEIADFDLTACGGTHVGRTGEIGLLKIIKLEKRGEQIRVEFACGRRALLDYRLKNEIVQQAAAALTTGYDELLPSITRLQDNVKALQRQVRQLQTERLAMEAEYLLASGQRRGAIMLVTQVFDGRAAGELRALASQLILTPQTICLLGSAGARTDLVFARATDAPGDMKALLQTALENLEGGRGGGSPAMAQGGGAAADTETVRSAIASAAAFLGD